jgi:hypothetical protein
MQAHLDVVSFLIHERPDLPANELPRLVNVYLATSNANAQHRTSEKPTLARNSNAASSSHEFKNHRERAEAPRGLAREAPRRWTCPQARSR